VKVVRCIICTEKGLCLGRLVFRIDVTNALKERTKAQKICILIIKYYGVAMLGVCIYLYHYMLFHSIPWRYDNGWHARGGF
jgi:hypothetical protein